MHAPRPLRLGLALLLAASLLPHGPVPARAQQVVIQPALVYSSYFGDALDDNISDLALDGQGGFAFAGARTVPSSVPDTGMHQKAWVARYRSDRSLAFSHTFGHEDRRNAGFASVAVDSVGNVYVGGFLEGHPSGYAPYPIVNALQPTFAGAGDAVLTKFSPAGEILFSTFLGGTGSDSIGAIAIDSAGDLVIVGSTSSTDFPGASRLAGPGGGFDLFLVKIDAAGTRLLQSRLLGGSGFESVGAMALDANDDILIAGRTASADFPTERPLQPATAGGEDGFVAKVQADAGALLFSTYLGGTGNDGVRDLVLAGPNLWMTGKTASTDFPTRDALYASPGAAEDGFLTRLSGDGTAMVSSTYLRGLGGSAVTVDAIGHLHLTGGDVTAAGLGPAADTVRYTYGGGGGNEIAVDGQGRVWIAGAWSNDLLPTTPDGNGLRSISDCFPGSRWCGRFLGPRKDGFVQVIDPARQVGPAQDERALGTRFSGTWTTRMGPDFAGGQAAYSEQAGATAEITFTGGGIQLFGRRAPDTGFLDVSLESSTPHVYPSYRLPRFRGRVDTYAARPQPQALLLSITGLMPGTHTLLLKVAGDKPAASTGTGVYLDGFSVVAQAAPEAPPPCSVQWSCSMPVGAGRHDAQRPDFSDWPWWDQETNDFYRNGSAWYAGLVGAHHHRFFTTSGVRLVGARGPDGGKARAWVDGIERGVVDFYAPAREFAAVLLTVTDLPPRMTHVLSLETLPMPEGTTGGPVWVDYLEAFEGPAPPPPAVPVLRRVEEGDSRIRYGGTWYTNTNAGSGHSGGAAKLAMDAGAYAEVSFVGRKFRWIGHRDAWSGIAQVYFDGRASELVDIYRPSSESNVTIWMPYIENAGPHTVRIHVTGNRNAQSGGSWVWLDAFEWIEDDPMGTPTPSPRATAPPTARPTPTPTPGGTPPSTRRVEENDPGVTYNAKWFEKLGSNHSGGRAVLAMDAGTRAFHSFYGTGVSWIGHRDEWAGIARVYLDGALVATVDTYRTPSGSQQVLYAVSGLDLAMHTVTIEATGQRNTASGGAWIWVDAFDVTSGSSTPTATPTPTPTPGPTSPPTPTPAATPTPTSTPPSTGGRFEENHASVSYTGSWFEKVNGNHSGGRAVLAMDAGRRATFTFTGTGVKWIGHRDEWSGIARVYVDGTLAATVDSYKTPGASQQVLYSTAGLSTGTHTLAIEVTGQRSAASGGAWIWVDAFDVSP